MRYDFDRKFNFKKNSVKIFVIDHLCFKRYITYLAKIVLNV